jgi:DnaJ homolog subfamily C member 28
VVDRSLEIDYTMDFKDYRKQKEQTELETPKPNPGRFRGKFYYDYIEEQIRQAQERGEFDNLPGFGKPLRLEGNPYEGDKAMGYHLLKNNGLAPSEIELLKEIRTEYERIEAKLARLCQQGQRLRQRRVSPFPSEKRAFNRSVEKAAGEYERVLGALNKKILTLNLIVPLSMHQNMYDVEQMVQRFRESCPLFE